jgi:hypothetical protein
MAVFDKRDRYVVQIDQPTLDAAEHGDYFSGRVVGRMRESRNRNGEAG